MWIACIIIICLIKIIFVPPTQEDTVCNMSAFTKDESCFFPGDLPPFGVSLAWHKITCKNLASHKHIIGYRVANSESNRHISWNVSV